MQVVKAGNVLCRVKVTLWSDIMEGLGVGLPGTGGVKGVMLSSEVDVGCLVVWTVIVLTVVERMVVVVLVVGDEEVSTPQDSKVRVVVWVTVTGAGL